MRKWIIRILLILVVLFFLSILLGWMYLRSNSPDYNEEVIIPGIDEQVDVYYDQYGIPHIYAQSIDDAYKAFGYVHAKDRMWQMELLRRIAPGRLSELLGQATVETDRFFKTIGIHEQSKVEAQKFLQKADHDPLKNLVLSYIAGINHFIANGKTPIEYAVLGTTPEEFSLANIYDIMGYMAFSFNVAHKVEPIADFVATKLGPDYLNALDLHIDTSTTMIRSNSSNDLTYLSGHFDNIINVLPSPQLVGSNSWVIGPSNTSTGGVIFANDPHIGYAQPSVWYEAHISTPSLELYGNHIAGYPIAHIGHSRHHAIGLTMFENDDVDYYREVVNPENEDEYYVIDHWEEFDYRLDTIKVKGGDDIPLTIRTSRHGPIISDVVKHMEPNDPVSMFWVYREFPLQLLEASYQIISSKTIDDVRKGASMIHAPGLNVMYGDVEGNIAWWASAKLPKRPPHVNSKLILDGSTGKDDITDYFDFDENPQSINPEEGYVYSANNQSIGTNDIKVPGYYLPEDRAKRIVHLLSKKEDWDTESAKEMILDVTSLNAVEITSEICSVLENQVNNSEQEVLQHLCDWNGNYEMSAIAPTIYTKLIYGIMSSMMEDELGKRWSTFNGTFLMKRSIQPLISNEDSPWWDNKDTDAMEDRRTIVYNAFQNTLEALKTQLGSDHKKWTWNRVHTLEHKHTFDASGLLRGYFNVGPFQVPGASEVINNYQFISTEDGTYETASGPSCRRIINLQDLDNDSWSILPTGQSGNVFSPHYEDQALKFVRGEFRQQLMNEDEIRASSLHHTILK